ncbi:hypothetical protein [Labrenzia sp. THAF35]|uniref:hypothetical protein n=1 Tax=Labrenzia sp. THAF35 TaxID=2587854 RepID=UPI0012696202|nr:hypothetical protein [Labrenzia sp. THAF35]
MEQIKAERAEELKNELAAIDQEDTFAQYWAQSPSASVIRDYKAGRTVEIKARRIRNRKNREALSRARKI